MDRQWAWFGYGLPWLLHRIGIHRFCWKKSYPLFRLEIHTDLWQLEEQGFRQ